MEKEGEGSATRGREGLAASSTAAVALERVAEGGGCEAVSHEARSVFQGKNKQTSGGDRQHKAQHGAESGLGFVEWE